MGSDAEEPTSPPVRRPERPFGLFGSAAPDWRIWFGLVLTASWLVMLSLYIEGTIGWSEISRSPIQQLGGFLEGAFAPLAFLWLVIGYFLQKKELMQNTDAIKMQYVEIQRSAVQAEIQSQAILATEMHARKESFLRIADAVKLQLGGIMGFLFISSQGATGRGEVSGKRIAEFFGMMTQRDPEVFSRLMLELLFQHGERYAFKVLYGTPIRIRHCESFIFSFERLIATAREFDDDDMIVDAMLGSGHGLVYQRLLEFRDSPPEGFTFGEFDFDPDSID